MRTRRRLRHKASLRFILGLVAALSVLPSIAQAAVFFTVQRPGFPIRFDPAGDIIWQDNVEIMLPDFVTADLDLHDPVVRYTGDAALYPVIRAEFLPSCPDGGSFGFDCDQIVLHGAGGGASYSYYPDGAIAAFGTYAPRFVVERLVVSATPVIAVAEPAAPWLVLGALATLCLAGTRAGRRRAA
jgi:hypothetical protein